MVACSSKDDTATNFETNKTIEIATSINSLKTRAIDGDNLQDSHFNDGAQINVYLTKNGTTDKIDNLTNDYVTYTFSRSNFKWTPNVEGLKYPSDGTGVDAFGIYPATVTKATDTFEVEYDQYEGNANYLKSDLMYAYTENTTAIENPITLEFNHCLTKVTLKILPSAGMTKEEITSNIADVCIENVKIQADLSFSNNKITATAKGEANTSIVIANANNFTTEGVSGIIIPQTIPSGTKLFYIDTDSQSYYFTTEESITFEAGKEYIFTITLGDSGMTIYSYWINDWTPVQKTGTAKPE